MRECRDIATIIATTFITWMGLRATAIALPLVALEQTGEAWTTGLVGGVAALPVVTVPWWGRRLRHRLTRGPAISVVLAVQVVGLLVVPIAAVSSGVDVWQLCLSGLLVGTSSALATPAERALLSDIGDRLSPTAAARALTAQDMAHRVTMVIAPPLGAWAVALGHTLTLLWSETVTVAVAALLLLTVRGAGTAPSAATTPSATTPSATTATEEAAEAIRHMSSGVLVRDLPRVALSIGLGGVGGVTWFAFSLGLAILGAQTGRPGALIAAGMTGYGAGSMVAAVIAPVVVTRLPAFATAVGAWIPLGAAFVAIPLVADSVTGVAVVAGLGAFAMPFGIGAHNALIATSTTGGRRRAVFALDTAVHNGGAAVGMLLGGAVIGWAGPLAVLTGAGALQVVAAVGGLLLGRRLRGDHSRTTTDERTAYVCLR